MSDALKCGTCKHWHKNPTDPMNVAAPAMGVCRASPPSVTSLPAQGGSTLTMANYPTLAPDTIACSQHQEAGLRIMRKVNGKWMDAVEDLVKGEKILVNYADGEFRMSLPCIFDGESITKEA